MKRDDQYFIVGLVSFLIALFLLPFSLFVIPVAWFGISYYIPSFLASVSSFLQSMLGIDYFESLRWISRVSILTGFFFAVLAYFTSSKLNRNIKIEEYIHENDDPTTLQKIKEDRREFFLMLFKYFGILVVAVIILRIINRIFPFFTTGW